jgi:histidinol-phosphate/aromatic aminotransferase/cobyric acid decarboxylase-like protein
MQALILAAGMGRRLKELTKDSTKCMVKVNGKTLIERMLFQLDRLDLTEIIIVVGYKAERLISFVKDFNVKTQITFVTNDVYEQTNNIYSLYLARNYLINDDTLLLESDLIFSDDVLNKIMNSSYPNLSLVAKYENWMDGTVVTIDDNNNITSFVNKKEFNFKHTEQYYKTVNIYKFSKHFSKSYYVPFLEAYIEAQGHNAYYEQVLKVINTIEKSQMKATILENEEWYEIDDTQDLDIAESIFSKDRLIKIQNRFGGYWRYPKLIDFCYLVNPFFPPPKMIEEIKANIEQLIVNYPSGMEVNSLLAGKYYGIHKEHICPGNGAAELINSMMKMINGKIGIIFPTFEEYPNRLSQNSIVPFYPKNRNLIYNCDDLMNYFDHSNIKALLLINPDNPSGNFIDKSGVLRLAEWAEQKGVRLIVDESFVDFVDAPEPQTLLSETTLQDNKHLVVVKSISKSFGVPGLRLGVIGSSDEELIRSIKKDVSIWNINSIAEFYLQICEKYIEEYRSAIQMFKSVREEFLKELRNIPNLRVIPTQANFVTCEVLNDYPAPKFSEILLCEHNILIKDLSAKKGVNGQYIRLAIKTRKENKLLLSALHEILDKTKNDIA